MACIYQLTLISSAHRTRWMSPAALDLAEMLLAYDPSQRFTAVQAMDAPYFKTEEPPAARPVGYVHCTIVILVMLLTAMQLSNTGRRMARAGN